jgi:hypothetical protein
VINRRGFIGVLAGAVAAPAVVRAASIMPVSALHVPPRIIKPVSMPIFRAGFVPYNKVALLRIMQGKSGFAMIDMLKQEHAKFLGETEYERAYGVPFPVHGRQD